MPLPRPCKRCGNTFPPNGKNNRICEGCKIKPFRKKKDDLNKLLTGDKK